MAGRKYNTIPKFYNENKKFKKIKEIKVNIISMSHMFEGCESLISISDIFKWDTSNVKDMSHIFEGCKLLKSLPDISKWNTNNIYYINDMFSE